MKQICDNYPKLLSTPTTSKYSIHSYYRFYTYVKPEGLKDGWNRDKIIDEINKLGVPCFSGSCSEIYLESAFNKTGFKPKDRLPIAKSLGETSLVFLVHPSLTKRDIKKIKEVMYKVFNRASKN